MVNKLKGRYHRIVEIQLDISGAILVQDVSFYDTYSTAQRIYVNMRRGADGIHPHV